MTETAKTPCRLSFFIVALSLAAFLILLFVFQRYVFVPKVIVILLIVLGAALMRRLPLLIKDWFVFISFVYLFDSLRGSIYILTCKLGLPVYTTYVIGIEKALFGQVPSNVLQARLLDPAKAPEFTWLEKALTAFHGSHFIAFLLIGFIIWLYKSGSFRLFRTSYYLLIFLGILGYFLVPTVPPWMAANDFGLLPPIIRFNAIIFSIVIPDISTGFDTNPIAAMPSLHAALAGFDVQKYSPALVCIEAHNEVRKQILEYFLKNNYLRIESYNGLDPLNYYFTRSPEMPPSKTVGSRIN